MYNYDTANHLTEVQRYTTVSGTATLTYDADYAYNAFGLRVQKVEDKDGVGATHSAVTSKYEYDGWYPAKSNGLVGRENFEIRAKLDSSNAVATQYLYSDKIDNPLGRIDVATNVRWSITDYQGSIRTILDETGARIRDIAYDGFGNITTTDVPLDRGDYAWTGREYDVETGLQYNRARWYDPSTGRWLTADPLGFDAGDTNLYRYVSNRATGAVDPSGLQEFVAPPNPLVDTKKTITADSFVQVQTLLLEYISKSPVKSENPDGNGFDVKYRTFITSESFTQEFKVYRRINPQFISETVQRINELGQEIKTKEFDAASFRNTANLISGLGMAFSGLAFWKTANADARGDSLLSKLLRGYRAGFVATAVIAMYAPFALGSAYVKGRADKFAAEAQVLRGMRFALVDQLLITPPFAAFDYYLEPVGDPVSKKDAKGIKGERALFFKDGNVPKGLPKNKVITDTIPMLGNDVIIEGKKLYPIERNRVPAFAR